MIRHFKITTSATSRQKGGRIEKVDHEYIERHIFASFSPDEAAPNRMEGLEPYFWRILPLTLSRKSCDAFLRATSPPVDARDYYLSKLFYFLEAVIRGTFGIEDRFEEWPQDISDVAEQLHETLDTIPDDLLPGVCQFEWTRL